MAAEIVTLNVVPIVDNVTLTVTNNDETTVLNIVDVIREDVSLIINDDVGPQGPEGDAGDYFGVSNYSFTLSYDGDGDVSSKTYSNGVVLTLGYDVNKNVITVSSSDGKLKTITYGIGGDVISVTLT